MEWTRNAERMRRAASAAAALLLCVCAALSPAQPGVLFRSAPAMRAGFGQNRSNAGRQQAPARQDQTPPRQFQNQHLFSPSPRPNYGSQRAAPALPANGGPPQLYPGAAPTGSGYPGAAPPGHLGDWLSRHQGLAVGQQEQLLRSDPSFKRLPQTQQQRLVQQLHNIDQMPEAQRQQRLARSEMLERMSPEQQMQVRQAGRLYNTLAPDRQTIVKRAFRDLRSVPLDQRDTVINSARYQNQFSPQERGILTDLLRAEPYEPAP